MKTLPLALLALELGLLAAAAAELLGCEVGVAEATCLAGQGPSPWGLLAPLPLLFFVRGRIEVASRALLPLLALALVVLRARLGFAPTFAEVVLAPVAVGASGARLVPSWGRVRSRVPLLIVAIACGIAAVLFAREGLALLADLALGFDDVGSYAVRLEGSLRGNFLHGGLPGQGAFWDHVNPGLALLVPFYAALRPVLPGASFLVVVQALALAACPLLAFGLARHRTGDPVTAALLALAFLLAPAFTHLNAALSYGFHSVTLALAALLGAAWAYSARRPKWALVLALLAWSFEETVAPTTFGAGVALALHGRRRLGIGLAAASLAYFVAATSVVIPLATSASYDKLAMFRHLGDGPATIALSPVLRPRAFFGKLLEPATFSYLGLLLAPWLFLPLARPRWAVAAVPVLLFTCLRDQAHVKSIALQYQTLALPWLFLALVEVSRRRRRLAAGALAASVAACVLAGDAPLGGARRPYPRRPGRAADIEAVRSALPPERVSATERLATHLAATHPDVRLDRGALALERLPHYALDLEDAWDAPVPKLHALAFALRREGYNPRLAAGSFLVLSKGAPAPPARDLAHVRTPALRTWPSRGISLLALERNGERARFVWRIDRRLEVDLGLLPLGAEGIAGEVGPIGPRERPTYAREAGETFAEERLLLAAEDLRVFDYLELARAGRDLIDLLRE